MLLVSPEVVRAFVARRRRDPSATIAVEAAAQLHLGRPPALPLPVATSREIALRDPHLRPVAALAAGARTIDRGGLRLTSLEQTFLDLLTRPAARGSTSLAGALLVHDSAVEGRAIDLRALVRLAVEHPRATTRRRVAFLLERAGHLELARAVARAAHGRGAVPLDPLGVGGRVITGHGVRVNTADGFVDREGAIAAALAGATRQRAREAFSTLALLIGAEVPLDATTLAAAGPAVERLAEQLRDEGLLEAREGRVVPVAPFDQACGVVGRDAKHAVALARRLERTRDPRAAVDAVLVLAAANLEAPARRAAARLPALVLDPGRAGALLALTASADELWPLRKHLLERLGRFADLAREQRARLPARGPGRSVALLDLARACWRLGRAGECRAHLRALEATPSGKVHQREVALLRASLAIESGAHDRARRLLDQLVRVAERSGDESVRARALHRLGALEARRGRFVEAAAHYRAALEAIPPHDGALVTLRGILRSNLAGTALWLGRWDEADREARAAIEERSRTGTAAEVLTTRVLLARVDRARGIPVLPEGRVSQLVTEAERTADARLRVETWLDLAEEHVRAHDADAAEKALEHAQTALALLSRAEPVLDAIAQHVGGLVASLDDAPGGLARIDTAVRALERHEGWFWAARARRDAASLCERVGLASESRARTEAFVEACQRGHFALGEDATHVAVYTRGALEGSAPTRAACDAVLQALGSARVRAALLADGRRDLAEALRLRPAPRLDAATRARLLRGVPGTLVLDERHAVLVRPDGVQISIARRRVLAPLLRALAEHAGEAQSASALIRTVWQQRESPSARAALKMTVSRLRALLGPFGEAVQVAQVRGELAYAWTTRLELKGLGET